MVPADVIAEAEAEEPLAAPQEQNLRFWTAALQGYSFADQTVAIPGDLWPIPPKNPTLTVEGKKYRLRRVGFELQRLPGTELWGDRLLPDAHERLGTGSPHF